LRSNAKVLAESLSYELTALTGKRADHAKEFKEVYDAVYLPRLKSLADGVSGLNIPASSLLRDPLQTATAAAQIETVIEVLENVLVELGKLTV
jgi:hypothetical protein